MEWDVIFIKIIKVVGERCINTFEFICHPPHNLSLSLFSSSPFSLHAHFTASSHHLFCKELRGRFYWLRSELTYPPIQSWTPALTSIQRAPKKRSKRRARLHLLRQRMRKTMVALQPVVHSQGRCTATSCFDMVLLYQRLNQKNKSMGRMRRMGIRKQEKKVNKM